MISVALVKGSRKLETVYEAIKFADGFEEAAKSYDKALKKVNFISTKTHETGVTTDPIIVDAVTHKAKGLFTK